MEETLGQLVPIFLYFCVLVVQVALARRFGGATALLLIAQAVFWCLSFVLRPLFLIVVHPSDSTLLADPRLAANEYSYVMTQVLWLSLLGVFSYVVALSLLYVRQVRRGQRDRTSNAHLSMSSREIVWAGVGLWAIGWIGRWSILSGSGSFLEQLSPMAVTGAVLLILGVRSKSRTSPAVGAVLALEVIWSLNFESKAALVLPVMAICLRWILLDRVRQLLRALPVVVVGLLAGFFGIQSIRGILTSSHVDEISVAVGGNPFAAYIVGLLQRFDGFSSVTDAVYLGAGNWLSTGEYLSRVLSNMVPKFGATQLGTVGQLWTREVRAVSVPTQYLDVPIAAGPTAEGYAMWGYIGVILLNSLLAIMVVVLGRALVSHKTFAIIFSVSMAFNTGIFEIALQGWAGSINKSVQALLVALPFVLVARMRNDRAIRKAPRNTHSRWLPMSRGIHERTYL